MFRIFFGYGDIWFLVWIFFCVIEVEVDVLGFIFEDISGWICVFFRRFSKGVFLLFWFYLYMLFVFSGDMGLRISFRN